MENNGEKSKDERSSTFQKGSSYISDTVRAAKKDRHLYLSIISSFFSAIPGAFLLLNMLPYCAGQPTLGPERGALLILIALIGMASGILISGRLSGRDIEFGIVPPGALLLSAGLIALALLPKIFIITGTAVFLAGTGWGIFAPAIEDFMRRRAPAELRLYFRAIALTLGAAGVMSAFILLRIGKIFNISPSHAFAIMGTITFILAIVLFKVLPDFFLRFITLVATRTIYKIRVSGMENIPINGPALLVCNHISYMDAVILMATQRRRLRFLIGREVYESWKLINPFFRILGCVPIDMNDPPKKIVASLIEARKALDDGFIVVIFAEGGLTRTGMLREFRKGLTRILKNTSYPIVPAYLGGAWGTITSYYHGRFVKWHGLSRYKVSVLFGRPLPPTASAAAVRLAVMELSCDYFDSLKQEHKTLGRDFIRTARDRWHSPFIRDDSNASITYGQFLKAALTLADGIHPNTINEKALAILLPPSIAAATANIGATIAGKKTINLDISWSDDRIARILDKCGAKNVLTSRTYLAKKSANALSGRNIIYIEDIPAPSFIIGIKAKLYPVGLLTSKQLAGPDDATAIVFSSGTTGEPKCIELTHHNILSNIEALRIVFQLCEQDNLCSAMPFSHSMGYTAGLWFPALNGIQASYVHDPLAAAELAHLARESGATILYTTPGLLGLYAKRATRADFHTLRHVLVGGDKLPSELAEMFEKKFGLRPLEGYGAAELAPVASLSVPHADKDSEFQTGWLAERSGMPLPGVAMKVVDTRTGLDLAPGTLGELVVKGPNVMKGYIGGNAELKTTDWHHTGDMARIYENGFVEIAGRAERFTHSKDGLIDHAEIEAALAAKLGWDPRTIAVVRKDWEEYLTILYAADGAQETRLKTLIKDGSLPGHWGLAAATCKRVARIPRSGGRLDIKALQRLASL